MNKNQKRKIWKKLLLATGLFALIFAFVPDLFSHGFGIEVAHAGNPTISPTDQAQMQRFASALNGIAQAINKLIWPILIMIGGLLDNSILFGAGMEERMREIWIPIRNIMNILFVVALIGIALYNVLGIGEENGEYSIKTILPKIAIGIIAVNFSFVGVKLVLDTVNVLTTAVFALPDQVGEDMARITDSTDEDTIARFCKVLQGVKINEVVSDAELVQQTTEKSCKIAAGRIGVPTTGSCTEIASAANSAGRTEAYESELNRLQQGEICDGTVLTPGGQAFLQRYTSRNVAVAMALSLGKILYYQDVPFNIDNVEKLFISTIFSALMYVAYLASFIALFIILLARLVVMWLAIVLSPIIMLVLAVPALESKLPGFDKIKEEFIKNAVVPLAVSIPLTVGWVMLKSMQSVNNLSPDNLFIDRRIFEGASNGLPIFGLNTLQDLVVAVGTLAVVWLGVFAAADASIARDITGQIKGGLEGIGKFIGGIPFKHIRAVPIINPQTGEKMGDYSFAQVNQALKNLGATPRDINQLYDDVTRGKSATTQDLIEATSGKDLVVNLKNPTMIAKLEEKETHQSVKQNIDRNPQFLQDIKDLDSNVGLALEEYYRKDPDADPDGFKKSADKLRTALNNSTKINAGDLSSKETGNDDGKAKTPDRFTPGSQIQLKDSTGNTTNVTVNANQATTLNTNLNDLNNKAIGNDGSGVVTELGKLKTFMETNYPGQSFQNPAEFESFLRSHNIDFEKVKGALQQLPSTEFPEITTDELKNDGIIRAFVKATGKPI